MSTSSLKVRASRMDDLPDLVDFQIRMALETEDLQLERPVVEKGAEAIFENPLLGHYVVCEDENELVGCLLITYEWSEWRNGLILWVQSVYVVPEYRKKGVFKKLYQHIQNSSMADERIRGIRLYVDSKNLPAKSVYERLGMKSGHYEVFEWMKSFDTSGLN